MWLSLLRCPVQIIAAPRIPSKMPCSRVPRKADHLVVTSSSRTTLLVASTLPETFPPAKRSRQDTQMLLNPLRKGKLTFWKVTDSHAAVKYAPCQQLSVKRVIATANTSPTSTTFLEA